MKIINTPDGEKYIPFGGAFIRVPVDTEFLNIDWNGIVYSSSVAAEVITTKTLDGEKNKLHITFDNFDDFVQVAYVDTSHQAQVISLEDIMAAYDK